MKRKLIAAAAAAAFFAAPAGAHGPGMSGGGMMMGPEMMGPGMMGGYGPQGMGPGMMGPGMMGPGMMGQGMMGQGMMGQGMMGQGMMGQGMMGGGMMGGGMMGGHPAVKLSDEQRSKISAIQRETSRKQWELMGKMHEQQLHMHDLFESGKDDAAARKAYDEMSDAHKQMFQNMLEARKRIDAVLTDEQRKQLKGGG
jgi:Spy/CpxP family protein refolding chaperone